MFQFPGFALKPLCIQGKSTCLTPLLITSTRGAAASDQGSARSVTLRSNNNRMSGGFPHSEISGSKPIPGSPKLNAGYHVLHRLLLPRHPPNALFALDLTRKEQGRWFKVTWHPSGVKSRILTHACTEHVSWTQSAHTVSVLDLEQYHLSGSNPQMIPYSGSPDDTDVSLSTMSISSEDRTIKPFRRRA